jgi:hypothetical protein
VKNIFLIIVFFNLTSVLAQERNENLYLRIETAENNSYVLLRDSQNLNFLDTVFISRENELKLIDSYIISPNNLGVLFESYNGWHLSYWWLKKEGSNWIVAAGDWYELYVSMMSPHADSIFRNGGPGPVPYASYFVSPNKVVLIYKNIYGENIEVHKEYTEH